MSLLTSKPFVLKLALMAAIQFFLCSALVIAIQIFGCESQYYIQVSELGHDSTSCIGQRFHACKTLEYVLTHMNTSTFLSLETSDVFINVTYNQTIVQKKLQVTLFELDYIHTISIVGSNNVYIIFQHARSSIQITQFPGHALRLSWIGLGFVFVDRPMPVNNEFEIPKIRVSLSDFVVRNCNFISVSLQYMFTQGQGSEIVISDNVFGNSALCPVVKITDASFTMIANNSFENCRVWSSVLDIQVQNHSITVLSNSFVNLKLNESATLTASAISISGDTAGILIQNNQFIGNAVNLIAIDATVSNSALIGNPCTWCTVQKNNFKNNYLLTNKKQQPILVRIKASIITINACPAMETSLSHNSFDNNTNTSLLNTEIRSKSSNVIRVSSFAVTNNDGPSGLITIMNTDPLHGETFVHLVSLSVENNTGQYREDARTESLESTIFYVKNAQHSTISNLTFRKNLGTSLVFENEQMYDEGLDLCAMGNLLFEANSGIYGGAMSLYSVTINSSCQSIISFQNNYGIYGGALYLENSSSLCLCPNLCLTNLKFNDNRATTSGNSVYFASSSNLKFKCQNFSMEDIGSAASSITLHSQDSCCLSIFPGQNIKVNISITDYFNQTSLCTAGVFISCDGQIYTCFDQHIKLSGPDSVVLVQPPNTSSSVVDTNLVLKSPNNNDSRNVLLRLFCKNSIAKIDITLNISSCPQGFSFNKKLNVCKCAIEAKHTICSTVLGAVCVSHGYWYGQVHNEYIVTRCKYSECKMNNAPCPPGMQSDNNRFLLNGTQCSYGRGGVLCRTCAENFVFSFLAIHCITDEKCSTSKAVAILFFAILFQILITISLVLVVRFKHSLGCGFLYGPMLFLAVVNHVPLDDYSEYSTLSTVVSIITSVALLNLELFGRIPWCFFVSIPKLYNYSLRVLGPLTVLLVLLGITALARWYPKCSLFEKIRMRVLPQRVLQRWHASRFRTTYLQLSPLSVLQSWLASPLKAMCILMMLSFWSLADISINILTPTVLDTQHYSMYMVSIQPDITFFSPQHLPLAIPALLVLLVVILPLVIILLSAPFLQRVINLFIVKPFLDEFQSCYKDKYRWYSGVYFVVWIAIVGIQGLPDSLLYTQTIFFILLCAQFLIKPYKSKLLNITDTLLLVDLNFLIALLYKNIDNPLSSYTFSSLLIHALIIVPFVCAILSLICLLLIKCGVYDSVKGLWNKRKRGQELQQPQDAQRVFELSHPEVPVQEVRVPDVSGSTEREPLIAIVDNQ